MEGRTSLEVASLGSVVSCVAGGRAPGGETGEVVVGGGGGCEKWASAGPSTLLLFRLLSSLMARSRLGPSPSSSCTIYRFIERIGHCCEATGEVCEGMDGVQVGEEDEGTILCVSPIPRVFLRVESSWRVGVDVELLVDLYDERTKSWSSSSSRCQICQASPRVLVTNSLERSKEGSEILLLAIGMWEDSILAV